MVFVRVILVHENLCSYNIGKKIHAFKFVITQANVDDSEPLKNQRFHEKIFGKLFGDNLEIIDWNKVKRIA
jgi:hypothetical protein